MNRHKLSKSSNKCKFADDSSIFLSLRLACQVLLQVEGNQFFNTQLDKTFCVFFFPSLDWVKLFLDWKIIKWYNFPWNLIFYKIHRSPQEHLEDLFVYCQGGLYQYSRNINNMTRNMNVKSVKTLPKRYASWSYFPCKPLYPYSASVTSGIFWTP